MNAPSRRDYLSGSAKRPACLSGGYTIYSISSENPIFEPENIARKKKAATLRLAWKWQSLDRNEIGGPQHVHDMALSSLATSSVFVTPSARTTPSSWSLRASVWQSISDPPNIAISILFLSNAYRGRAARLLHVVERVLSISNSYLHSSVRKLHQIDQGLTVKRPIVTSDATQPSQPHNLCRRRRAPSYVILQIVKPNEAH